MEEKEEMIDIRINEWSDTDRASVVACSVVIGSIFINFCAFILTVPLHLQISHNRFISHHDGDKIECTGVYWLSARQIAFKCR